MGIKTEIRESTEYKKFKKIVQRIEASLKLEKDQAEALSMHAGRTSRKLYGEKRYSPKALMDAAMNDMSVRSRLVELRVQCSIQIDTLEEAIKAMKHSILTAHSDKIKAKYKTVGERNAFLDNMLSTYVEMCNNGLALVKLLDNLVQDIDKASYQLKIMSESLQLLDQSKGGKVI